MRRWIHWRYALEVTYLSVGLVALVYLLMHSQDLF